ncbi:MAG: hypothetical protein QM528_03630 [Phycisphaerales bacterium]|nr:hypothetical protein [Phycisphaerales bacterium]
MKTKSMLLGSTLTRAEIKKVKGAYKKDSTCVSIDNANCCCLALFGQPKAWACCSVGCYEVIDGAGCMSAANGACVGKCG